MGGLVTYQSMPPDYFLCDIDHLAGNARAAPSFLPRYFAIENNTALFTAYTAPSAPIAVGV